MPLYSVDFTVYATAYIRADSEEEAKKIALASKNDTMEVNGNRISDLDFDDPDLPDFSFSPAMTISDPDLDTLDDTGEE